MDGFAMESSGAFAKGVRAALASGRLLETCKSLLILLQSERSKFTFDVGEIRSLIKKPEVVSALTVIAEIEGNTVPSDLLLLWPVRGLLGVNDQALEQAGIITFGDVIRWSPADLLTLKGIGPAGLAAIDWALSSGGLRFATPDAPPARSHPIYALPFEAVVQLTNGSYENILRGAGIGTVADLITWSSDKLFEVHPDSARAARRSIKINLSN